MTARKRNGKHLLAAHSFRDPATAFRVFKEFAEGPGYVHVSPRTAELARELIPKFLALCPTESEARPEVDSVTPTSNVL